MINLSIGSLSRVCSLWGNFYMNKAEITVQPFSCLPAPLSRRTHNPSPACSLALGPVLPMARPHTFSGYLDNLNNMMPQRGIFDVLYLEKHSALSLRFLTMKYDSLSQRNRGRKPSYLWKFSNNHIILSLTRYKRLCPSVCVRVTSCNVI